MTRTDQAFISAFQQAQAPPPSADRQRQESLEAFSAEAPSAEAPVAAKATRNIAHGPHPHWKAKVSLTDVIAERMRRAAAPAEPSPAASVWLRSFQWPGVVEKLAARHADEYRALAPPSDSPGAIGVAGVHLDSGATTTTLSLARCLAPTIGRVAVVDADPSGPGLAASLGVLRAPTLADAIGSPRSSLARGASPAVIHAKADGVSLAVAGDLTAAPAADAASTATALLAGHALTLVDLGASLDRQGEWIEGRVERLVAAFSLKGVLLVRCDSDLSGAVAAAARVIDAAGAPTLGLIENRLAHDQG